MSENKKISLLKLSKEDEESLIDNFKRGNIFTMHLLKNFLNLCERSNVLLCIFRIYIDKVIKIKYDAYIKDVDAFLNVADSSKKDSLVRFLCACIFQDEAKASEYSHDIVNSILLKLKELIIDVPIICIYGYEAPPKKFFESILWGDYEFYMISVNCFLKAADSYRKNNFVHFLCACIFQEEAKAIEYLLGTYPKK